MYDTDYIKREIKVVEEKLSDIDPNTLEWDYVYDSLSELEAHLFELEYLNGEREWEMRGVYP